MVQETKLDLAACAGLLGLPLKRLRAAVRDRQFPDPAGYEDGQPYWLDAHAYGWALSAAPEAAGRVPLWWWPDAGEPAVFRGPRDIGGGDVALGWEVPGLGEVFMAWPSHDTLGGSDRIVSGLRDAAGVVGTGARSRSLRRRIKARTTARRRLPSSSSVVMRHAQQACEQPDLQRSLSTWTAWAEAGPLAWYRSRWTG